VHLIFRFVDVEGKFEIIFAKTRDRVKLTGHLTFTYVSQLIGIGRLAYI